MLVNCSWKEMCAVFIVLWIVAGASPTAAQVFEGDFPWHGSYDEEGHPIGSSDVFTDMIFNLNESAVVSFEVELGCKKQDLAYVKISTAWDGYIYAANGNDINLTHGPFPLTEGSYEVELGCSGEFMTINEPVEYNLIVTPVSAALTFTEDAEPDMEEGKAITLNSSQSFKGKIGLAGYYGLKNQTNSTCQPGVYTNNCGMDGSDDYYFKIDKDVRLQFRLNYDDTFIDNPQFAGGYGGDLGLVIYYRKDGHSYWVADFDNWTQSGDISKEIITPAAGVYHVGITGGYFRDADGVQQAMPKDKSFGGYLLRVMLNGEPVPEELLVTVQAAKWETRQIRDDEGYKTQRYLNIKFEVENTYDEAKKIINSAFVTAPAIKYTKQTGMSLRDELVKSYQALSCQFGKINWDEFCNGERQFTSYCTYYGWGTDSSAGSSIAAHSTKIYTLSIPASNDQYNNFDESYQIISVKTMEESATGNSGCYVHGISFWPLRAFTPAINFLLSE